MTHVWTWGGKYFGFREGDDLWTHTGIHVGRFNAEDVCDKTGSYLGEVMNGNRLIVNLSKKSMRYSSFSPWARRAGLVKFTDYVGYAMYVGHEDFPPPERFT